MFSFAIRKAKAALTRLRNIPTWLKAHKRQLTKGCFLVSVFLFGWVIFIQLPPMQFPLPQGNLSYQLATGSISGGYTQFSLGPIGSVNFRTHAVPIDLRMNLVLNRDITTGQDLPSTFKSKVSKFKYDAVNAFYVFLAWRVIAIALIGLAAGMTISWSWGYWFKWKIVKWSIVCFVAPALVLIGISYLTLDRTPKISYTGEIAQDLSKTIPYFENVASGYRLKKGLLQNFVDGAVILSGQMNSLVASNPAGTGTQILVASDIHDNAVGMQIVNQLVNTADDFSAVILAGDITNGGYSWESHLFDSSLNVGKVPVYFVGGNHENTGAMQAFQQMGYKLLGSHEVNINGVTVIGQSDPTAYTSSLVATPQQLLDSSESLDGAWYGYANLPDVVVVHELAQANDVIDLAKKYKQNLTVVYGHDHVVGHKTDGTVTLVDSGTGGASGLDGVVRKVPYTYQILDFSSGLNPRLTAVLTLQFYDPKHVKSVVLYPIN
jgi:predicted phosphodiesterase